MEGRRREVFGSIMLLAFAALACGGYPPHALSFEPHSMRMNGKRIALKAIRIGPGDVGRVRTAGGLPSGTLVMRGEGDIGEVHEAAAAEAAEYGGTHYMLGEWSEEFTTTYTATKWGVVPHTTAHKDARYVVIRVPQSGWHRLSADLTPVAFDGPSK